ncbi:hypothetical protein ACJX0J_025999, partial [Zea mays]
GFTTMVAAAARRLLSHRASSSYLSMVQEGTEKKIYTALCERHFGFGCDIDEETSNKLEDPPGVSWIRMLMQSARTIETGFHFNLVAGQEPSSVSLYVHHHYILELFLLAAFLSSVPKLNIQIGKLNNWKILLS